jgi:hypothetical protein
MQLIWCQPLNKQLERTVIRRRGRAARASRWLAHRAAAELRRSATQDSTGCVFVCF